MNGAQPTLLKLIPIHETTAGEIFGIGAKLLC
jgi:hypothetical protein